MKISLRARLLPSAALLALCWSAAFAASTSSLDARGIELLAQGKSREALKVFDRSLAKDPDNPRALANRCTARYRLGDFDGAIADFEAATRLSPKLKPALAPQASDAYYRRACRLSDEGETAKSAEDLYASVRLDRKNAASYAKLGELALAQGDHDTALPYLDRALKLDRDLTQAWASRAELRLRTGLVKKALQDIDTAILLDPAEPEHFLLRARIHDALDMREAALKDERRARELRAR